MKNPKVGERVNAKYGLKDGGRIIAINPDGNVQVEWHYQDGSHEISNSVDPKKLKREPVTVCEKCGRAL